MIELPILQEIEGKFYFTFAKEEDAKLFYTDLGSSKFFPNKKLTSVKKKISGNTVCVYTDSRKVEELECHYLDIIDNMTSK